MAPDPGSAHVIGGGGEHAGSGIVNFRRVLGSTATRPGSASRDQNRAVGQQGRCRQRAGDNHVAGSRSEKPGAGCIDFCEV